MLICLCFRLMEMQYTLTRKVYRDPANFSRPAEIWSLTDHDLLRKYLSYLYKNFVITRILVFYWEFCYLIELFYWFANKQKLAGLVILLVSYFNTRLLSENSSKTLSFFVRLVMMNKIKETMLKWSTILHFLP